MAIRAPHRALSERQLLVTPTQRHRAPRQSANARSVQQQIEELTRRTRRTDSVEVS